MSGGDDAAPATSVDGSLDGSLYADVLATLREWAPPDEGQARLRDSFLAHLGLGPESLSKQGPPAHLTASCLVLDAAMEQVLLTHHRRAEQWFQFGGHLEPGDVTLRAAARREATEESGIPGLEPTPQPVHLDRHTLVGSFGRCREHLDVRYAAVAPAGLVPRSSPESLEVRWWPLDALPQGTKDEISTLAAAAGRALAPPTAAGSPAHDG